tara:strand:+ start:33 stop:188 length:156 start_codon:yes stop_codon:yes gene_type:complete
MGGLAEYARTVLVWSIPVAILFALMLAVAGRRGKMVALPQHVAKRVVITNN